MPVWTEIKAYMTVKEVPGSVGYLKQLNNAVDLFMIVLPEMADQETEKEAFNADSDVREALLNRRFVKEVYGEKLGQ